MATSRLDQVIEVFAEHEQLYNPATVAPKEKSFILSNYKDLILSDVRDEEIRQMKKEIQKEAAAYKHSLFKKVRTSIIVETIFVAFLIGLIVNQVTYLLPQSYFWAGSIIVVSLLLCVLFISLESAKD